MASRPSASYLAMALSTKNWVNSAASALGGLAIDTLRAICSTSAAVSAGSGAGIVATASLTISATSSARQTWFGFRQVCDGGLDVGFHDPTTSECVRPAGGSSSSSAQAANSNGTNNSISAQRVLVQALRNTDSVIFSPCWRVSSELLLITVFVVGSAAAPNRKCKRSRGFTQPLRGHRSDPGLRVACHGCAIMTATTTEGVLAHGRVAWNRASV